MKLSKDKAVAALLGLALACSATSAQAEPRISLGEAPPTEGFELVTVVSGLEHPWGMAWLPDGAVLVSERPGRLWVVRDGQLADAPVSGVPDVLAAGQGGLLDVAVHPGFETNGYVYLTYAAGTADANRTRLVRGVLEGNGLRNVEVIFEVEELKPDTQHFGSRILWLGDGTLLVSIGDGGNPPVSLERELIRLRAQETSSALGKILRLSDDGSAPADNPFSDEPGAGPLVWSYGHRNVQGMALDTETGAIWVNEHGALAGDELNRIERGANYGWPAATYSRDYRGATEISPHTTLPGMTDPVLVWMDTQAPSGLAIYRGDAFPEWRGDLFSGGLVTEEIRHISLDEDGRVEAERTIPIGSRVRDVREGPDGYLYVLTDERNGALMRLEPSDG